MRRLRVVIVASWWPTVGDPVAGCFIADQALALATRHDVAVIAPSWVPMFGRHPSPADDAPLHADEIPVLRPRVRAWLPRRFAIPVRPHAVAVGSALADLERRWGRPDLLHAHVLWPAGAAAIAMSRARTIPVVLTEHTGPFSSHLRTVTSRRLTRETLTRSAAVIAVGPGLAEAIEEFAPRVRVRVVGNVVDVEAFAGVARPSATAPRAVRVLCVGNLVAGKGVADLLRAVALLRGTGRPVHLRVLGDGPELHHLEALARELGIDGETAFLGRVDRDEVVRSLAWSDLLAHPSHHETFAIVVAEAMAAGRPVVVARSGGPESFVRPDAGVVVEPGDIAAMADGIDAIASGTIRLDPERARDEIRRRFSGDAIARELSEVYAEVLHEV